VTTQIFQDLIEFLTQTEKLKTTLRHSYTSNSRRQESVAEHTWHLCLLSLILFPKLKTKIDQLKTLQMLIIHDLAETITGDIPVFRKQKMSQTSIYSQEKRALQKILKPLSPSQQQHFLDLWQEFEANQTPEAKLANAIDKLEAVIQHNISDIATWDQGDFDYHPYCRNEYFDFDPFMRQFKDFIDDWSMRKIDQADQLGRIDPKHIKTYHSKNRQA
jgi:putative hydrolase of HD superfamily